MQLLNVNEIINVNGGPWRMATPYFLDHCLHLAQDILPLLFLVTLFNFCVML